MEAAIPYSVCPHDCASACALDIDLHPSRNVARVKGSDVNSYTAGVICSKVARYGERIHNRDRILSPLRRKTGKTYNANIEDFEPVSWDAALDLVAESFVKAAQTHGMESIWLYNYAGTMGKVQRDAIVGLRNIMGYSRQKNTICSSLMRSGMEAGIGAQQGSDPREFSEADLIVIWGSNPVYTQVNLMKHISVARKNRGARMIVIDPYRTPTADQADLHLQPKPGTDAALACAVMHVLFRDGFADHEYMSDYTNNAKGLETHLIDRGPNWASNITGISVGEIEEFAKEYGTTRRAIIRLGYGFSRSRNGASSLHAVSCLPAVRAAWKHYGGGLYGSVGDNFKIDTSLITGVEDPTVRVLDMSRLGPILTGDVSALDGGPPVTAMLVQSSNPAAVAPESAKVREGLLDEQMFLCVHEQFLTDTAKLADVVLPATTFLEHDDFYMSYGHSFLQLGPKVLKPAGQSLSNHDMLSALANRLGVSNPLFNMSTWAVIDEVLKSNGLGSAAELKKKRLIDVAPAFEEAHFLRGFPQPDGRFQFKVDWSKHGPDHVGLPSLPDFAEIIDDIKEDRAYRLITGPSRNFLNTTFTETRTSTVKEGTPSLLVHRDDLKELALSPGDLVRVGNEKASIVIRAEACDAVKPGVVIIEGIWPNSAFKEGIGVNALISAEPGKPNGGAVFHDTSVWITPA